MEQQVSASNSLKSINKKLKKEKFSILDTVMVEIEHNLFNHVVTLHIATVYKEMLPFLYK